MKWKLSTIVSCKRIETFYDGKKEKETPSNHLKVSHGRKAQDLEYWTKINSADSLQFHYATEEDKRSGELEGLCCTICHSPVLYSSARSAGIMRSDLGHKESLSNE